MTKLDEVSQLPVENSDPRTPYDFTTSMPGALKRFVEGEQWLAAWGLTGEALWKGCLSIFLNRMSGYTTDNGSAIIQEFDIPSDESLTQVKWTLTSERGTKAAVFDSLHQLGHDAVSIYNSSGRVDSPYASNYSTWQTISASAPSSISERYTTFAQTFPQLQTTGSFSGSWATVVVWDCSDGDKTMSRLGSNFTLGSTRLGNNAPSQFSYTGEKRQLVIEECAKLGTGLTGMTAEVFFVYPNKDTLQQSRINFYGLPYDSDYDNIEYVLVDVAETINSY